MKDTEDDADISEGNSWQKNFWNVEKYSEFQ